MHMTVRPLLLSALVAASSSMSSSARAQQPPDSPSSATTTQAPSTSVPLELDQALVNVPTTRPLGRHRSSFRLTHRFGRDLRRGSFGQLAEDFFSLDNGAIIALEYRFGITDRLQAGVHRSILGKTIETFGRWDGWRQADGAPIGLSVTALIEGQNNLRLDPQPGISVTVSRVHGPFAVYATPTFVKDAHTPTLRVLHEGHSHGDEDADAGADASAHSDANDTAFVGLGVRTRVRQTVSLVAEVSPRVYGYRPDRAAWAFGVEKTTRGHVLQLNFGNSFGTSTGQVARGGSRSEVYMGFNLSRKF
jgi:hypothetical protein